MSWHSKLNCFLWLLLFSLSVSPSVSMVQQRPLRSNPLDNTIQWLQHSTVRVFYTWPPSVQCQLQHLLSLSFLILLLYLLGCFPLLRYLFHSITFSCPLLFSLLTFPAVLPLTCHYVLSSPFPLNTSLLYHQAHLFSAPSLYSISAPSSLPSSPNNSF